ncbi:hypothetical protein NDU88_006277 [Pleurodeles waltl]|uniref:Uncharacterized protein n=1 Tax=Pleurodeles waltl TaxID=8319 RepID=A0AAV7SP57_PLEWA|nr:hypothetical protein NDU88_006277 [Pleurodeles waltl]
MEAVTGLKSGLQDKMTSAALVTHLLDTNRGLPLACHMHIALPATTVVGKTTCDDTGRCPGGTFKRRESETSGKFQDVEMHRRRRKETEEREDKRGEEMEGREIERGEETEDKREEETEERENKREEET